MARNGVSYWCGHRCRRPNIPGTEYVDLSSTLAAVGLSGAAKTTGNMA